MIKIGITGGIGSGKSTVCEVFKSLGVPVYHADQRAKVLMNQSADIREGLIKLFGEQIYQSNLEIDRAALSAIIFNNKQALSSINELIHPAVYNNFFDWCTGQQSAYVLMEAAILFESGGYKKLDKTILVTAPEELRIKRVQKRDKASEQEIKARINNQLSDKEKLKLTDYIIVNDGKQLITPVIVQLHKQLSTHDNLSKK